MQQVSSDPWSMVKTNWLQAKRDADRFYRWTYTKASLRHTTVPGDVEERMVDLDDLEAEARQAMLHTPAPNRAALRQKIDAFLDLLEDGVPDTVVIDLIRSDTRRHLADS